jgi:site-specific recombinase XerC
MLPGSVACCRRSCSNHSKFCAFEPRKLQKRKGELDISALQRLADLPRRGISGWQACCQQYASSTINLRLAAVRRLAYEASDAGLLSPDFAAGIRRVKGAKKHGVRLGNWLTVEQGRKLLSVFDQTRLRGVRDYAMIAVMLGCGLGRADWRASRCNTYNGVRSTLYSRL